MEAHLAAFKNLDLICRFRVTSTWKQRRLEAPPVFFAEQSWLRPSAQVPPSTLPLHYQGIPYVLFFPPPSTKKPNMLQNRNQIYSADILIKKSYKSGPPQVQTLRCEVYVNSYIWRMNKPLKLFKIC